MAKKKQNIEVDIDHLRTFFIHAKPWLKVYSLEKHLGLSENSIKNFIYQKQRNGNTQGLGVAEEIVYNWAVREHGYDPKRQYDQFI